MNFSSLNMKRLAKWLIGIVAACILIFLGVQNIGVVAKGVAWFFDLIMPLIIGVAFALVLNVPMRFFERHLWCKTKKQGLQKLRRPTAYLISLALIIGILVGVVWLVIPELINAVKVIVQGAIDFINTISAMDKSEIAELPFGSMLLNTDWDKLLDTLQTWLKDKSGTIMNTAFGTIGSIVGGVFDFFISFVFSIYLLFSKDKLKNQAVRLVKAWIPNKFGDWSIHAASVASVNFRNFISGQSLEAAILGILCMIGMFILQIPYAPMVSALVGVTALIPVVGGFIGAIVGAFMILTVEPIKAVIFVVFLVILQQLEGNLIYPKVMGSKLNLPAMWILAAVTVGGGVAGPIGMLLSVPIASTSYLLFKEATLKREEKLAENMASDDIEESKPPI